MAAVSLFTPLTWQPWRHENILTIETVTFTATLSSKVWGCKKPPFISWCNARAYCYMQRNRSIDNSERNCRLLKNLHPLPSPLLAEGINFLFVPSSIALPRLGRFYWLKQKFGFIKRVDKGFRKLTFRALALRQSELFALTPLSTRLIKPNFCFDLPHRRSTTVSLETRNPFLLTAWCNTGWYERTAAERIQNEALPVSLQSRVFGACWIYNRGIWDGGHRCIGTGNERGLTGSSKRVGKWHTWLTSG